MFTDSQFKENVKPLEPNNLVLSLEPLFQSKDNVYQDTQINIF